MVEKKYVNYGIASLVLGIISIGLWFFGLTSIISIIVGIVGLVLASKSKQGGHLSGIRTAGFITSLIGLIGGGIESVFVIGFLGTAIANLAIIGDLL